ncbi:GNAT family N-acetyltransferase [Citricoccus nitrophenolicus]|uniref:RimJ/RimL family protein N-acetyltransferase n=1 Tax=Citricoccus muralis TaxID=169134 RepID=A0A3D9L8K0_9MICC|nr:GNAT family N-acetyltransferase [Citricoccus muralis]REE02422.1 RimJ/RimL family protein N-acetyltransferase [Citricoccus muralis]
MNWPAIEPIESTRVDLDPLTVQHAPEMLPVLADPSIYEFTGGTPPTLEQLQRLYRVQTLGHSDDNTQWWLNWVVALHDSRRAVGYVQATVERRADELEANIAWVISPAFQGRGLATEATASMIGWLMATGVDRFVAYIHPDHAASAAIARKQGLHPTSVVEDGETRWQNE